MSGSRVVTGAPVSVRVSSDSATETALWPRSCATMASPRPSMFMTPRGAGGVDATPVDLAFGADEISAADGAAFREDNLAGEARVVFGLLLWRRDDLCNLRDNVAASLDGDEVANPYTEAFDLVGVVERGACDGGAADEDGNECGHGRDLAGAADLEENVFKLRDAGTRGELVGDGPAWSLAGEAEAALLCNGVDLENDTVDLVGEFAAELFGFVDELEGIVDGGDGACVIVDEETGSAERVECGGLCGEKCLAGFSFSAFV